jgi:NAD-dependent deacetylase
LKDVAVGRLIVFSGAGLSAESGIQTFRGASGLWNNVPISDVCDYLTWRQNYQKVHDFYNDRRVHLAGAEPNAAHRAIRQWQDRYETLIVTQNIDDLLERAGCEDVLHLHGFLTDMHCETCGAAWSMGYAAWNWQDRCRNSAIECDGWVKPSVVFFNERAPAYSRLNQILTGLQPDDVIVVMGTSSKVIPFHIYLDGQPGFKIANNLEPDPRGINEDDTTFDVLLFKPATQAVEDIDAILRQRLG